MNFRQLEQYFITETSSLYDSEEAKHLFDIIIEELTGWGRSALLMRKEEEVPAAVQLRFDSVLKDINAGVPVQHIFAEAWFYGLKFKVNSSVLIPRPETEELVEWILQDLTARSAAASPATLFSDVEQRLPAGNLPAVERVQRTAEFAETTNNHSSVRILDIGTGSGCIAISLQKFSTAVQADAVDVSPEALATAQENALINAVKVNFELTDILNVGSDPAGIRTSTYDVIVSNPPYIKADERSAMHQNVLDHEPHLALFVTNENPLIFYKAIADFALDHLEADGLLYFEINEYLGAEMVDMVAAKGFKDIVLKQDMQGKDRMLRCRI